jgi:predicted RNA binding protein YcfA (HicA-like mRNA interferase family)
MLAAGMVTSRGGFLLERFGMALVYTIPQAGYGVKYSKQVWDQLKGKSCDDLLAAIKKDGFALEATKRNTQAYINPDGGRAVIHYQPNKSYGRKLLKDLLEDIGWSEADMRRLKLIK